MGVVAAVLDMFLGIGEAVVGVARLGSARGVQCVGGEVWAVQAVHAGRVGGPLWPFASAIFACLMPTSSLPVPREGDSNRNRV